MTPVSQQKYNLLDFPGKFLDQKKYFPDGKIKKSAGVLL
jgi:hypothetical protein